MAVSLSHQALVASFLVCSFAIISAALSLAPKHMFWLAMVYSLPWWLPALVVKARFWIFTAVNGEDGRQFPTERVGGDAFKWLYNHKAVSIRSRQVNVGISGVFHRHTCCVVLVCHPKHFPASTDIHFSICFSLRSVITALTFSDLFWYMLAPAHYIHQEHLESDSPQYPAAVAATKAVLNSQTKEQFAEVILDSLLL